MPAWIVRIKREFKGWGSRLAGPIDELQRPHTGWRVENLELHIACFVMHGPTVFRPITGTGRTADLHPTAVRANHLKAAQRMITGIGNRDKDVKVEVIGWKRIRFLNGKGKGRGWRRFGSRGIGGR